MNSNLVLHHSCGFIVYFVAENGKREYLLLQYPEGHWDFVKGHIDDTDLSLLDTAKRELEEETGIKDINVIDGFFETAEYFYFRDGCKHEKRVDFYLGEISSKEIVISHEHTHFDWQEYSSALNKITFENAKNILIAAESFLS